MIKIRYADLPHGLHARVHTGGRRPVIYLLPGLSAVQRRDALGRLIRASRQGHGPRLRAPEVRFAVALDVVATTVRNGMAAVRCHPAGSAALAAVIAAGVICYAFFVTVTVRFTPQPAGPPVAVPGAPREPVSRSPDRSGRPAGTQPATSGPRGAPSAGSAPGAGAGPGSASAPSGQATGAAPLPTGTWSAPGGVLPSASAGPSSSPSPSPSATPSPVPSPARPGPAPPAPGAPGGLCLRLGPLGVCISG